MANRKEINDKIVAWIINKVKTEYADDVSLVLIYGSYINGTANSKSDVDCYYIPKTERGYHMAVDFMIDGVGYDIFPMSWERVAGIADLKESLTPLVGDVQIIYHSGADELERFQAMQERLKNNLLNEEYVKEIAQSRCAFANELSARMKSSSRLSEVRKIAGHVIMFLADAVAVYHHDYYHFGLKKQYEDLANNFSGIPQSIIDGYHNVVTALNREDTVKHTLRLLEDVCEYLNIKLAPQEDVAEDGISAAENMDTSYLAGLYEEISSTFNKIYVCCEQGNDILAFLSAVCLQRELDDAREAGCPIYDLLSHFDYRNLKDFAAVTQDIEKDFVQLISNNGGQIKSYDSFEQFESAKL